MFTFKILMLIFQNACGKEIKYDTKANVELSSQIEAIAKSLKINAIRGNTMASNDFYEGLQFVILHTL